MHAPPNADLMPTKSFNEETWRYMLNIPVLRNFALRHYKSKFENNISENLFEGVFSSFEEAQSHIPSDKRSGYDNDESANLLYTSAIAHWDYPAMFWISRSMQQGMHSIFDLGGHIGIKYYAFRRSIGYPASVKWTVCDVPAVVRKGQEISHARDGDKKMFFTEDFNDIKGHDVLYASGSLQYLPSTLSELLASSGSRPRRIIINITPIHADLSYFTLNNIGSSICPYRIQARDQFVRSVLALGYSRAGEWENIGKGLFIPKSKAHTLAHYSGFCFDLNA